jgi:trimethylamine corrinoid protein
MATKEEIIKKAKAAVMEFDAEAAEEVAKESIKSKINPVEVIHDGFTKGMTDVGELFGAGKLYLPHVIAAAEAMQSGVNILTPELEKLHIGQDKGLGTVAIGTIEGDIHSIGKDIVAIMLKVAGFNVINLGRDVPLKSYIEAAKNGANAIGSSALMTTTMVNQMHIEQLLKEEGLKGKVKTMVGGAPVTQTWADQIGADIYAENANDAITRLKAAL